MEIAMSTIREKRRSCEACRARKLRCSGKETGCSRCVHLGLVCKFHEKGRPGRPRKWLQIEHQQVQENIQISDESNSYQRDSDLQQAGRTPLSISAEESSIATCGSADFLPVVSQEWTSSESGDIFFNQDEFGTLPLLHFTTTEQLDSLPLETFRACLSNGRHNTVPAELSSNASIAPASPQQSCDCTKKVFGIIRSLKSDQVSHNTVGTLRLGADLVDKLLVCPVCYDVTKPPRITLQNVLLVGRLFLEVTAGYMRYLKWLKEYCASIAGKNTCDAVYLIPGADLGSALSFKLSSDKFYEVIVHGLKSDAEQLSELGSKFALRQHNRHLIGHEACPDSEGHCWKEKGDIDPDPSDVCPQSPVARTLTPCYRIVDEARSKIKDFEDAVT